MSCPVTPFFLVSCRVSLALFASFSRTAARVSSLVVVVVPSMSSEGVGSGPPAAVGEPAVVPLAAAPAKPNGQAAITLMQTPIAQQGQHTRTTARDGGKARRPSDMLILAAFLLAFRLLSSCAPTPSPCSLSVVSLCTWSNPLQSGLTLLCALLLTFLLRSGYTLVTLVAYLAMLQLMTCFVFINGSQLILKMKGGAHKGKTTTPAAAAEGGAAAASSGVKVDESVEYVSLHSLQLLLPVVHTTINGVLQSAMFVIRCGDNSLTLRVIAWLLVASLLGRVFDGVTLFGLAVILLLSAPKAYAMNRSAVDRQIDRANWMIDIMTEVVQRKVTGGGAGAAADGQGKEKKL